MSTQSRSIVIIPKWYTVPEVAQMLGYGLSKTKLLVISGDLRSLKDGRNRRILPEWVDEEPRGPPGCRIRRSYMSGKRTNGEGSIYAYRNGFAAYVWVSTPQGRRQRKFVYGKTKEIVHERWLDLHQRSRRGPVVTRMPTVAGYLDLWLKDVVIPNLAPATASNYKMFTRLYVIPDFGPRKLDKLGVRDVQTWLNELKVTGCQCCTQGKDAARDRSPRCCAKRGLCCRQVASDWTVHQAWTILRSALSAAQREEIVHRNVAALVRLPVPRTDPGQPLIWSVDQARQFLESAHAGRRPTPRWVRTAPSPSASDVAKSSGLSLE